MAGRASFALVEPVEADQLDGGVGLGDRAEFIGETAPLKKRSPAWGAFGPERRRRSPRPAHRAETVSRSGGGPQDQSWRITSLPGPPDRVSLPAPPYSLSSPLLPYSLSSPLCP